MNRSSIFFNLKTSQMCENLFQKALHDKLWKHEIDKFIRSTILATIPETFLVAIPETFLATIPETILVAVPETFLVTIPENILAAIPETFLVEISQSTLSRLSLGER